MQSLEVPTTGAVSETLRRALVFDHIRDAVVVVSLKGMVVDWNAGAERIFGWAQEEILGQPLSMFDAPTDQGATESLLKHGSGERMFVRRDGSTVACEVAVVALRDPDGTLFARLVVYHDVTRRREMERRLADERGRLRTVLDAVADPIFLKDCEGRFVLLNTACMRLFGIDGVDIVGKTDLDFPGIRENAGRYATDEMAVVQTGESMINREEPFIRSDGAKGWFLTSKFPLRDVEGEIIGLTGICRDITELKAADEELERTRLRMVDHVENSPLAVIEWQPELIVDRWGGQAEGMFGWSSGDVIGKKFHDLAFVHPEDVERVGEVAARLLDGRDRRNICHNRNLTKSGAVVHCVWHNSVLRDAGGRIVSVLSLVEDVTERVQAENAARAAIEDRASIERKLKEAQKLESLGVLAGGIAHDFNNLLTGILGNASMAATKLGRGSPAQNCLDQIEVAATRAAELCKQMLAYSGKGRFLVRNLDLNGVVRETTDLLRISIGKNVALQFDLVPSLPQVLADCTQMRQVIMNLVLNAAESFGDRSGVIRVSTGVMHADRAYFSAAHLSPDLPAGKYVYMDVADEGCGMPPEVMERIFDPFFTTKFAGRGLGLAAVLGIVRGHRGALKVESRTGEGTVFRILLPVAEGSPEVPRKVRPAPAWRGKGVALVVDDEEILRTVTTEMLESLGFRVITAVDGEDGVEKFIQNSDDISVVLLDLTMPRKDGVQALREMLLIRPDVRTVLMSGYSEQEAVARFTDKKLAGFLQKPFRLADLAEKLQQALA